MPRRAQKRKYFAGTSPCDQMTGTRRTPEAACGAELHRQHASLAVLAGFPQDGLWHRERAPRKSADALFSVVIHFWILRPRPADLRHGPLRAALLDSLPLRLQSMDLPSTPAINSGTSCGSIPIV